MAVPPVSATHPDAPEELIPGFDADAIPETTEDFIPANEVLAPQSPSRDAESNGILPLPPVMLGCATFGYGVYADTEQVRSSMPVRVVRAALRAGVNAFDTGESGTRRAMAVTRRGMYT